jgi:hypothetical protein
VDQYRRAVALNSFPERFQAVVLELLRSELAGLPLRNPFNVLGVIVQLAGSCHFTDVGPKLRDWIRQDALRSVTYRIEGEDISIRRTLWSILIGWGESEGLKEYLLRDLDAPGLDCGPLCFSALGRLDPRAAIQSIPRTIEWPAPYWREVLRSFFVAHGAPNTSFHLEEYALAWKTCFEQLRFHGEVSERAKPRWQELLRILEAAGLMVEFSRDARSVTLIGGRQGWDRLAIDLTGSLSRMDSSLFVYFEGLIQGAQAAGTV